MAVTQSTESILCKIVPILSNEEENWCISEFATIVNYFKFSSNKSYRQYYNLVDLKIEAVILSNLYI